MGAILSMAVTSLPNFEIDSESITHVTRTAATTTVIYTNAGTQVTLTHAADTVGSSVAEAIDEARETVAKQNYKPKVQYDVTLPQAVSATATATVA